MLGPLEQADPQERETLLCFLAGGQVELEPEETNGALRRAELLLAAGGDPRRAPDLTGRAVTAVARDLDTPERRRQLAAGLAALEQDTRAGPAVVEALQLLRGEPDLAWQCFAAALLAERLGSDDDVSGDRSSRAHDADVAADGSGPQLDLGVPRVAGALRPSGARTTSSRSPRWRRSRAGSPSGRRPARRRRRTAA